MMGILPDPSVYGLAEYLMFGLGIAVGGAVASGLAQNVESFIAKK
tara:strand:- start:2463 stop:2597 length:135 start_codon:yes stop_codon:yes gene_type:complete